MKRIIFILFTLFSVQLSAQIEQPRIKFNQVIKDSTGSGRIVISSLTDSSMIYSPDFYINTVDSLLILFGDTVQAGSAVDAAQVRDIIFATIDAGLGVEIDTSSQLGILTIQSLSIEDSVYNGTASLITKGTPLYVVDIQGNYWSVAPAQANDPTKMPVVAIAGEDIADGQQGLGLLKGHITGVNTELFAAGDEVWVGATGGYTNIRPKGEDVLVQKLGTVVKANANGSGIINLGEVQYNLNPNNIFIGGADSLQTTANLPTVLSDSLNNYVTIAGTDTITGAKTFTAALTQSGGDANFDNNTLYVDESENRVGIGTSIPSAKVQVDFANYETGLLFNNTNTQYALIGFGALGVVKTYIGYNTSFGFFGGEFGVGTAIQSNGSIGMYMDTLLNIYLGSSIVTPTAKLDVDGNIKSSGSLTLGTPLSVVNGGTGSTTLSGAGIVTGSGTTNYLPKFTSSNAIGNSQIYDLSGNILIGTTSNSEGAKLKIEGGYVYLKETDGANVYLRSAYDPNTAAIQVQSASDLAFATNNITRMTLTSDGNLGLGVTPSAWASATRALQVGTYGALAWSGGVDISMTNNAYYDGTNWVYIASQEAGRFLNNRNTFAWYQAAAGLAGNPITFTQAMTLFSTGNLAVGGTSDAGYRLDISGAARINKSSTTTVFEIYNTDTNDGNGVYIKAGGLNSGKYIMSLVDGSNNSRVHFLANGNVGIGTTVPDGKLDVNGTSYFRDNIILYATKKLYLDSGSDTYLTEVSANTMQFVTGGSERMRITSSGNVGIGTSSPQSFANLQVKTATDRNAAFFDNASGVTLGAITDAGASATLRLAGNPLVFTGDGGAGAEHMRIDASGNLGLGVSPSNAFAGSNSIEIGASGVLWSETIASQYNTLIYGVNFYYDAAGNTKYKNTNVASTRYWQYQGRFLWDNAPSGTADSIISFTNRMTLDENGSLLISRTSSANSVFKLQVGDGSGDTRVRFNSSNAYSVAISRGTGNSYYIGATDESSPSLVFSNTAGTERMRITDAGNVGIGTTSPDSKLEVNGSATNTNSINTSSDTINYSLSNIAYTDSESNSITLTNIKDGGAYTLISTATNVTTELEITATNFDIKYMGTVPRTYGKQHIYSFIVAGTDVYVTMGTEN